MGAAAEKKSFAAIFDGMGGSAGSADIATPAGVTVEFVIKKFVFRHLLEKAGYVISPRDDVMPVLKNFQFDVAADRIRVIASDLELSVIAATELVTVTTPGIAVFPAGRMLGIVREATDGPAHIQARKGVASVTIGPTTWNLKLQGGYDFPAMPEYTEATYATVDRATFTGALHAVRYAASKEAERASLMMIDITGGRMTACDGSRIQQTSIGDTPFDFQIPIGAVADLLKLLKGVDLPTIRIGQSTNHLIFQLGADTFLVNKLNAQFPDMEKQLLRPALENKHALTVDRDELLHAVRRVRINADPETSAIALRLSPDRVTVAARDKYGNEASEPIHADWSGPERSIVVNHAFLTDMINSYEPKDCLFALGEDTKTRKTPVLLKDPHTGTVGLVQQMLGDWVGAR